MAWLYGHIHEPLDHFVYRRTSGRATLTTWLGDVEMAMLTTTGAKTRQRRNHVVLGLVDGERGASTSIPASRCIAAVHAEKSRCWH